MADSKIFEALENLRKAVLEKIEKVQSLERKVTDLTIKNTKIESEFRNQKSDQHAKGQVESFTNDIDLSINELKKIIKSNK